MPDCPSDSRGSVPRPPTIPSPVEPVIEVQDLRFAWHRDGPDILAIEALRVVRGERLFIQGPSGSGKSTLLSLLGGVNRPRSGRLRVLERDLSTLSGTRRDRFRADHIGFIFQMFNLLPYLSVVDNVLLPLRFSRRRRQRAGGSAAMLDEARRLLAQLGLEETLLTRPVTELSVGQQQRVAAARALIGVPELLIADEPTSALDADRRRGFLELLFAECDRARTTLVFVSHDAALRPSFDRGLDLARLNQTGRD